jgi:hypothetical protein
MEAQNRIIRKTSDFTASLCSGEIFALAFISVSTDSNAKFVRNEQSQVDVALMLTIAQPPERCLIDFQNGKARLAGR